MVEGSANIPSTEIPTVASESANEVSQKEPLVDNQDPSCSKDSQETREQPTEEQPTAIEEQPVATEEQPMAIEEQPTATEEQPMAIEEQPIATEEQPTAKEEQPIATEEQPGGTRTQEDAAAVAPETAPPPRPPRTKVRSTRPDDPIELCMTDEGMGASTPITIGQMFKTTVERFPNNFALAYKEGDQWTKLTYSEYYNRCVRAAKSFIKVTQLICNLS